MITMATTLAYVFTDADIPMMFKEIAKIENTFNAIAVMETQVLMI